MKKNKGHAILTSKKHQSGTDRIWEAYKKIKSKKIQYIINLQGDEPLIDVKDILNLNKVVRKYIVAKKEIKKGEKFSILNLDYKRTGKKGISPMSTNQIINKKAKQNLQKDDLIVI